MYFSFDAQHEKCFKYLAYSHQYLTNVKSCYRRNHGKTIHPTEIFILMNLLQVPEKNYDCFLVLNIQNLRPGYTIKSVTVAQTK